MVRPSVARHWFVPGFALLIALLAPLAPAQPWGGGGFGAGGGDILQPGVSRRDMDRYAAFLALDEDQREAAMALLDGYQAAFDAEARVMRDAMDAAREEFRDTRDPSIWREIGPRMQAFGARREAMEAEFLGDVRELLTDGQAALWPRMEMMRRRDATLRRGFLSGESVDLVRVVEDERLSADEAAAVRPILDRYEQDMDRALTERNRVFETNREKGAEAWQAGDMDGVEKLFAEARDASIRVRDLNRQYARQIAAALPAGASAAFERDFQRRSFPRVYREGYTERAIDAAAKFDDLTTEQRETLGGIRQSFERELGLLQTKQATAQEEAEVNRTIGDFMGRGRGGPGGGDRSAVREARAERRALEDRFLTQVKEVLTPEQVGRLPDRRDDGDDEGQDGPPGQPRGPRRDREPRPQA